jgi:SWI/SNF-related matrix-associated actin-dependent regulator of chromatin subfamily A containing DEAD/H box 1
MYAENGSSHNDPSSDPIDDSDEELFGPSVRAHETVETVPLPRPASSVASDSSEDERHETVATIPLQRPTQQPDEYLGHRITQLDRQSLQPGSNHSMMPPSSPTSRPFVQVTASSPVTTPTAQAKPRPRGYLGSVMAPAGTSFRRPVYQPPVRNSPIVIEDDEGPTYKGGESSDEEEISANAIKPTDFRRSKPDNGVVPESPAKKSATSFSSIVQGFGFDRNALNTAAKRPRPVGDDMASAYGNASKKSRQTGPSRIVRPGEKFQREPSPDMELDDIQDYNERRKVKHMQELCPGYRVKTLLSHLRIKKGAADDAVDVLVQMTEEREALNKKAIDLTASDDELNVTPAVQKRITKPYTAKQQSRNQGKTIADKWSSTQNVPKRDRTKPLDAFSPLKPETKKRGRLVRGRRDRSSPDLPDIPEDAKKVVHVEDDSEDDAESEAEVVRSASFDERVLEFFNTCSGADLADTASIDLALAEHFVSQQPFRSAAAVEKVDDPKRKPTKSKAKRTPIGEKIWEKVSEMITAYEAVDYLVDRCERLAEPLAKEMRSWGVNITGAGAGELKITNMSQSPSHDSGIGTPSDEEKDKLSRRRKYITQPEIMNADYQLNDYQIVGMNWLNLLFEHGHGCILADEMGLGKTYQVIAFLTHLYENQAREENADHGTHLIVVPSATLENWLMEFKKFSPVLTVEPYYGSQKERAEMRYQLESTDDVDVIVTTYAIAKGKEDAPWLREFGFTCTVFDEGHYLKNAESKLSRALCRIKSDFRVLLTGTPLQNNLKELMSLLSFMMPDLFNQKSEDLDSIFTHHVKTMDEDHAALLSAKRIARARSMLTPFILRRKKSQVVQLPPKERRVEYCDLTNEQAEIYHQWFNRALDIRTRREAGEDCGAETTHILMKLRQAAIHPMLFRRLYKDAVLPKIAKQCLKDEQWALSSPELIVTELDHYSDMEVHTLCAKNVVLDKFALKGNEWLASGKVQKMLELLRNYIAEGSRTLIFSQFVMVLDILELVLNHEMIEYFRLDGSTRVSDRQDLINAFSEEGNKTPVFLLSTKAGGAGINLAAANKVIVFDSGFNPQDDVQAENRAHRIGQHKPVEVVRLVSKGTVEEAIYKMGLTKVELDQRVAGTATGGTVTPAEAEVDDVEGKKGGQTEAEKQGESMVAQIFFDELEPGRSKNDALAGRETNVDDVKTQSKEVSQSFVKKAEKMTVKDEPQSIEIANNTDQDIAKDDEDVEEVQASRPKRAAAGAKQSSQASLASTARFPRSRGKK